ncbi:MAG: hypothetical protein WA726_01455 [Acidimicrobiia bacterium]
MPSLAATAFHTVCSEARWGHEAQLGMLLGVVAGETSKFSMIGG